MAGVKITDLTPLATAVSGDLLYIVDISDTTESPQGTSKQIEVGDILALIPVPYLTWVGKLTQTGSADPTGVVFENTLGVTLTYGRNTTGEFTFTSPSSLFSQSTTLVLATAGTSTSNDCFVVINGITSTKITFSNYGNGGGLQDDFANMNFEIRVY